jgi:Matrixin
VLLRALRFGLLTVGFALLALGPASTVRAYVLTGGKWSQPGGSGSPVTLTYSFQNMFDGGLKMPDGQPLPNSLIRNSIEDAMRVWASVAPINYVEVPDNGRAYGVAGAQFGQIRFRHIYINGPDPPPPALPVAKAQAYFPGSGDYAGDVEYDDGDRWQEVGTLPIPDILGATIHELGHTLGLNHTDLVDANMYWIFTRYSGPGTGKLFPDDIAGVQALYGAGRGSVTSLVPEPATFVIAGLAASMFAAISRTTRRRRKPSV